MNHRIDLAPARRQNGKGAWIGHGAAFMSYGGQVIGESREPLFAAARYLIAHSLASPGDIIQTFRNGVPCMRATVAVAADCTVQETAKAGPRIVKYRPFGEGFSALELAA